MLLIISSVAAPEKRKSNSTSYCYDTVDGKEDENAFAIFNFKYRSLGRSSIFYYATRANPISDPQSTAHRASYTRSHSCTSVATTVTLCHTGTSSTTARFNGSHRRRTRQSE
jgi:hypothetical protein